MSAVGAVVGMLAGGLNGLLGWAAYKYLGPVPFGLIEGTVIVGSLAGMAAML